MGTPRYASLLTIQRQNQMCSGVNMMKKYWNLKKSQCYVDVCVCQVCFFVIAPLFEELSLLPLFYS